MLVELVKNRYEEVVSWRRWFHQYPELSGKEAKTAEKISEILHRLGIPHEKNVAGHGVVGLIKGRADTPCVLLRADMDALPIEEQTGLTYASKFKGAMHACGHDMHMANLLGVASILNELKDQLYGSVKLVFQPSEETLPGGAIAMIEAGILSNPQVHYAIGLHVIPELSYTTIGVRAGRFMAATDEWYLTLRGKSAHAAQPQQAVDPLPAAAQILLAIHGLKHRLIDPLQSAVITPGKITSNGRTNIISNEVSIEGTFRCFDEQVRQTIRKELPLLVDNIAKAYGVEAEFKNIPGYPVLVNDKDLVDLASEFWQTFSDHFVVREIPPRLTAEDFAYFSQHVPSLFYRLGVASSDSNSCDPLHTPTFNPDEKALYVGMLSMSSLVLHLLRML
ncbi:MAG: M20 family metallopeptidase [Bacteroidales bacterium]|nr:M20 family metallopeptidase [Bacteroidales bacterium]